MDHDLPTSDDVSLAQGLLAELNATLERARDERFRMVRLVKDCESRLGSVGATPSQDTLEKLLVRVEQLNDAVRHRFDKLDEVDRTIDKRLAQLNRLENGIRELTARFTEQVAKARNFDRDIIDARRRIEEEARTVGAGLATEVAEAQASFAEHRAELEKLAGALSAQQADAERVVQQASGMIGRQVERAARDARTQLDAIVVASATALNEQAEAVVANTEAHVQRIADQMSDVLTAELRQQVDAHRQNIAFRDAALRDEVDALFAERGKTLTTQVEDHLAVLVEQAREKLEDTIARNVEESRRAAEQAVDGLSSMMNTRAAQVIAAAEGKADDLAESLRTKLDAVLAAADSERDAAWARLGEATTRFKRLADEELTKTMSSAHEKLRQLVVQAMAKGEAIVEPYAVRLAEAMDAHRQQLDEVVAGHERADEERERALRARMTAILGELKDRTETLQRDLVAHAQGAIKPMEQALRQQMHQARAEVEQQLAKHAASLRPQAEADLGSIEAMVKSRLSQLRGDAESMVELMARGLEKRVAAMEERAMETSHAAERTVRERLERMRAEVEETLAPLRRQTTAEMERITEASRQLRTNARIAESADEDREITTMTVIDSAKLTSSLDALARVRREVRTDQAA